MSSEILKKVYPETLPGINISSVFLTVLIFGKNWTNYLVHFLKIENLCSILPNVLIMSCEDLSWYLFSSMSISSTSWLFSRLSTLSASFGCSVIIHYCQFQDLKFCVFANHSLLFEYSPIFRLIWKAKFIFFFKCIECYWIQLWSNNSLF